MLLKPSLLLFIFFISFLFSPVTSFSQVKLSLKDGVQYNTDKNKIEEKLSQHITLKQNAPGINPAVTKSQFDIASILIAITLLPNPMLLYEDKQVYFGLTKQVSVMLFAVRDFGVGRLGFEYSFIINKDNPNHFRGSYIQDVVLSTSDFSALVLSFEGGYFSDLDKKGVSASAGFNILLGFIDHMFINPYLKLRHTFMLEGKPHITDLSFGAGLGFSFRD